MTPPRLALALNAIAIHAISLILVAAFAAQVLLGELPCPLCLLQRVAFTALAVGPILNLRFGPRPSHYALTLLAACLGAAFSMRQVLLHIAPGDPGYGSAILGLHAYTWAFLAFAAAILLTAVTMLLDAQFDREDEHPALTLFHRSAVWLIVAVTVANAASVLLECGFDVCADNPVRYELLSPG